MQSRETTTQSRETTTQSRETTMQSHKPCHTEERTEQKGKQKRTYGEVILPYRKHLEV